MWHGRAFFGVGGEGLRLWHQLRLSVAKKSTHGHLLLSAQYLAVWLGHQTALHKSVESMGRTISNPPLPPSNFLLIRPSQRSGRPRPVPSWALGFFDPRPFLRIQ